MGIESQIALIVGIVVLFVGCVIALVGRVLMDYTIDDEHPSLFEWFCVIAGGFGVRVGGWAAMATGVVILLVSGVMYLFGS